MKLCSLHGDVRCQALAPVPHEQRRLARRDQAVGRVGPEGGAGGVEAESAETAATEEAVLAAHCSIACSTVGQGSPDPLFVVLPGVWDPA
jgi:hypothetical protein